MVKKKVFFRSQKIELYNSAKHIGCIIQFRMKLNKHTQVGKQQTNTHTHTHIHKRIGIRHVEAKKKIVCCSRTIYAYECVV